MSDHESHFDFDDELLSAYLDDELAPEERARVEERLAADPAARQMLEQLRSVSHAVAGLPREQVGQDLRDAILQQAERAMLSPGAKYPRLADEPDSRPSPASAADNTLPSFSFGRTRRGWFWAGLAVAAALLVAFIQPEDAEEGDLPDVARRSDIPRGEHIGGAEFRAIDETLAESNEPVSAPSIEELADARVEAERTERSLAEPMAGAEIAPSARSRSFATSRETSDFAVDTSGAPAHSTDALAARGSASVSSGRSTLPESSAAPLEADHVAEAPAEVSSNEPAAPLSEEDLLVVHLNVTPAAFRNKAFDEVLFSNGIAVEPPPDETGLAAGSAPATTAVADRPAEAEMRGGFGVSPTDESEDKSMAEEDVDVVLVEAPPEQIFACLKTINDDVANYPAVEIEDPAAGRQPAAAAKNQALEEQWNVQFNRGFVPPAQKEQFRNDVDRYYVKQRDTAAAGEAGTTLTLEDQSTSLGYGVNTEKLGRAVRIQPQKQNDGGYTNESVPGRIIEGKAVKESEMLGKLSRRAIAMPPAASDQLQVLFVLKLEGEETTSPAAANPPE